MLIMSLVSKSQENKLLCSGLIIESVNICVENFNIDPVFENIPRNNIIIRPIAINKSMDSILFSLEMNATAEVLKELKISGIKIIDEEKSLFLQKNHMENDFTGIDWQMNPDSITMYLESLEMKTTLLPWEPHPLVAFCQVTIKGSIDIFNCSTAEIDYYLCRDDMPQQYFPVEIYPLKIAVDTLSDTYSRWDYIIPDRLWSLKSFKSRINFLYPKFP
jgi:hypothetical protein